MPPEGKHTVSDGSARAWLITHVLVHEAALRAYLARFLTNAADIADVIQDTYAKLLLLAESERRRIASPHAYLFTTARHVALDRLRRQRTVSLDALTETERSGVLGHGRTPDEDVNARQELALLAQAIAALPDRCRQVLTLRKLYGLSQKEIASRLGIAEHTVEKHIANGVRLCAEFMKRKSRA
jgi:RNA polymerase sigma-70 factor (ECF subfamily)